MNATYTDFFRNLFIVLAVIGFISVVFWIAGKTYDWTVKQYKTRRLLVKYTFIVIYVLALTSILTFCGNMGPN